MCHHIDFFPKLLVFSESFFFLFQLFILAFHAQGFLQVSADPQQLSIFSNEAYKAGGILILQGCLSGYLLRAAPP
jgi:hypothetical protein